MRKIVAPLALLASVSLLTSCTKTDTPVPVVPPVKTETPAPVEVVTPTPTPTPAPAASGTVEPTTAAPAVFTRTEVVGYTSPAGSEQVEFSVTVTDGVITAASATPKSEHEISKKLQTAFAGNVSTAVVGKKAKDLDVDAVGGASLTTGAFEIFARSFN